MPAISRIWARSALISAPGFSHSRKTGTRATGQRNWPTHPAVPPGTDDQNSTPARELEPPQPLLRSLDGGQHPCAKIGVSTAPMNHDVRAVLHCPAAAAQDRLGRWANIQELSGDRCLLSISTESLQWAAMALGSAGAEVTDVRPPQLAAVLRDWSDRFARAADLATAHG